VVRRVAFAVPGDLATPTGGYAYDRRMIAELHKLSWQVDLIGLGDGFPRPSGAQKSFAAKALDTAAGAHPVIIDGLALGVLPEAAAAVSAKRPLIALVHHPLALETGLSPSDADAMRDSERAALRSAKSVVVTSEPTAKILAADYGVARERITVARPGTDRSALPRSGGGGDVVQLLSVGALVHRKGFDVLIAALATLADLPWRLSIAGDRTRSPAVAAQLDADIARHGLGNRVQVLGAVSDGRIEALYAEADVFVLASRFEGYGMAYAEALARGLPVIGTTGGAIPDTVPPEAGVLVEPNDVNALARALRMLIGGPDERRWFAAGARAAGEKLPTWRESAKRFAGAIEALA
jgi:glycosyltransferase involved in cell wall biosynthesis